MIEKVEGGSRAVECDAIKHTLFKFKEFTPKTKILKNLLREGCQPREIYKTHPGG